MNGQNGNKSPVEGIAFSIFGIVFMLYWTYTAVKGGAYIVGLLFGGFGLFSMVRNLINQCRAYRNYRKHRNSAHYQQYNPEMYNTMENGNDPWDVSYPTATEQYGTDIYGNPINAGGGKNFCPYCGIPVKQDHMFCKNCGRQLPD